ncbi:MAG: SUMF1/EgtB/PvdO family nonheme iron enzyme [Planctomycetes bacterium]|nr:SUMF1/EgtB/PvdO family nonheme iron enzyme [Planctomycetota bacterium]
MRLPVRIDREGTWTQDINLHRPDEIPEGFCGVPGGPFESGGPWAGGGKMEPGTTEDLFVARFPTTCADYLAFLNDLCARGDSEKARRSQPRDGDKRWWIEEGGRFRLPVRVEDPKMEWDPRWPVFSINWSDAVAFCDWKSRNAGRIFRLMHEEEYEKATRGVDGRVYSYGDEYDGSYAHTNNSLPGRISPAPVDSFPADESPYGIRGLSGGIESWCANAPEVRYQDWRCFRGGAWSNTSGNARAAVRHAIPLANLYWHLGVRLALAPRTS